MNIYINGYTITSIKHENGVWEAKGYVKNVQDARWTAPHAMSMLQFLDYLDQLLREGEDNDD